MVTWQTLSPSDLKLRRNLFETPYAQTLLAFAGTPDAPGKAIGMAMYFHNFSTWTGKPGIYVSVANASRIRAAAHR